jgi:3-oxoacyl-[acyl-carrier-protein] synthase-1
MLRLAGKPMAEALAGVPGAGSLPWFLAGPEPIPDCPKPVDAAFLKHLHVQCNGGFHPGKSKLFDKGRASGIEALAGAYALLATNAEPFAIVGGVDTHLDLYLLGTLDMHDRVLADGVMDGFAPGEGAAFLVLASPQAMEKRALKPLAQLGPPALAAEAGHRYSQAPYKGDGLAQAITAALTALNGQKAATVFATMTGENFHAKEWGVASLRNQASLEPALRIEHPADCYGDPGAAAGPLLVGLAALGMKQGKTRGPCLVYCSSEHEQRGAVCLV